eukprot:TRINITY_DN20419_c0_g1_i1.p1 TRINITY_DN20419_c0_g1~~TRINITY_DN20419_c0_g1_i1.p1  ORF type:complete len:728 (-),score=157.86 TRINITY_DN20419_c0_g1_i1:71-2254(-)
MCPDRGGAKSGSGTASSDDEDVLSGCSADPEDVGDVRQPPRRQGVLRSALSGFLPCAPCGELPGSFLPPVAPEDPASSDVPFVGLLNPSSGSKMGAVFLREARHFRVYESRLFDIKKVATESGALLQFRRQLDAAREESRRKNTQQGCTRYRPRLICGGGDGTASFAISIVLKALSVPGAPLGSLDWSDDDLERYFPALVQMPLGTGNDLAGVLGWGRTIDPVSSRGRARSWMQQALSVDSPVVPFDVWALSPSAAAPMKVCTLRGVDAEHPDQPSFSPGSPAVPFLSLLYFSLGFDALVTALVEQKRSGSRLRNFAEYAKAIPTSLLGASRRCFSLQGVRVSVPDGDGTISRAYFPPPHRESDGAEFCSLGFMNINSFGGGTWSCADPARLADGRADLFRQKKFVYVSNVLKRGMRFRTEKHEEMTFHVPPTLPGVVCQCDGEAFYFFSPNGQPMEFSFRRAMQIPVVLGPSAKASGNMAVLPSQGGSVVPSTPFRFFRRRGHSSDVQDFRVNLGRWASGAMATELNASDAEIAELRERSFHFARGLCGPCERVFVDFGTSLSLNACATCAAKVANRGCQGCQKIFCYDCFVSKHLGSAPNFIWMFAEAGYVARLAELNSLRWSARLCLDDALGELEELTGREAQRPLRVRTFVATAREPSTKTFAKAAEAVEWLQRYRLRLLAVSAGSAKPGLATAAAAMPPPVTTAQTRQASTGADDPVGTFAG